MNLAQDAQPQDGGNHDQRGDAWLVYDGDCPFCSRYVKYLRLRRAAGPVRLVNAREGGPLVDELQRAGRNTALRLLGRTQIASPGCKHSKLAGANPDVNNSAAQ